MKELKRQLKIYPTLNTTMLVGDGITEQDIDDLCEAYGLIRCNFTKGFDHYIKFTKNGEHLTDFNQLFKKKDVNKHEQTPVYKKRPTSGCTH